MPNSTIHLIYASTYGNTETVIEATAAQLATRGWVAETHRAEKTSVEVVTQNHLFVFGTSTWEHGALNPFFKEYLNQLKTTPCQGKTAAFVGCGDRRYEPVLFCEGIEIIKRVWVAQQGAVVGETLKIQGEAYGLLDSLVVPWADTIATAFANLAPPGSATTLVDHQPNLSGKIRQRLGL